MVIHYSQNGQLNKLQNEYTWLLKTIMKVNKKPKELYKIYTVLKSRVLIHIYTKRVVHNYTNLQI